MGGPPFFPPRLEQSFFFGTSAQLYVPASDFFALLETAYFCLGLEHNSLLGLGLGHFFSTARSDDWLLSTFFFNWNVVQSQSVFPFFLTLSSVTLLSPLLYLRRRLRAAVAPLPHCNLARDPPPDLRRQQQVFLFHRSYAFFDSVFSDGLIVFLLALL